MLKANSDHKRGHAVNRWQQGSQFVLVINSRLSPGFVHVKKVIHQVIVQTMLAPKPKGRHQRRPNSQEYKNWKQLLQYNIEILYILTFQVLSRFSAKCLALSRISHILGQIPGYFWTWTDKIQFSRFPGSAGNPVISKPFPRIIVVLILFLHLFYSTQV